jgi:hypothetical protein
MDERALASVLIDSRVSSLRQVRPGARRETRLSRGDRVGFESRVEPLRAVSGVARNEGVPGSNPGVGFGG